MIRLGDAFSSSRAHICVALAFVSPKLTETSLMSTATREASLASSRRLSDVVLSSVVCSANAVQ